MATYEWTGTGGGDWQMSGDWTPTGVPGAMDTADFATGGNTYVVTGDGQAALLSVDADHVTFEGNITAGLAGGPAAGLQAQNGADVTVDQPALLTTTGLEFSSGTSLTVDGLLIDTGGGTVDTALVAGPDATFTAEAAVAFNHLMVSGGATFASDVNLAAGGSLLLDTSAVFGGGTLSLAGSGSLLVTEAYGLAAYALSESIVLSGGVLTVGSGAGVLLGLAGPISGAGALAIDGGTVALSGPNTYTGFTDVHDATLTLSGAQAAGTGPIFLDSSALTVLADGTGVGNTIVGTGGDDTVYAGAGDAVVFAGHASVFAYTGGAGANTVVGGSGVLIANGGAGDDVIFGGTSGQDRLTAGEASTTLVGGNGGMLTATGVAGDVLVAAAGNTTLNGADSAGDNVFFASGSGSTVIEGGSGTSTIVSSGQNVSIYGSVGTENVFLNGGSAQLSFVDGFNGGTVAVVGFGNGDYLHAVDYPGNEVQAALNSAVVYGDNTVITLTDSTHIVLYGFTGLSAADFR